MTVKPTYEELEKRVWELERESKSKDTLPNTDRIQVSGINIEWNTKAGTCSFENLPVAMMWVDTTLAGLMSGVQAMVGTKRFGLALQSEGRKSVEEDWKVISQFSDFKEGFKAIANIAAVAGWGDWKLISLDQEENECRFQIRESWEGVYQKSLGLCWGSGMLAGKLGGYCSKYFQTNCWSEQIRFIAKGDEFDEFVVRPSERSIEKEIEDLLVSDEATRADMAVALEKLKKEVSERKQAVHALLESEEKYRLLIENANDAIFIAQDEVIKFPNPRAQEITGYSEEELDSINFSEFIHPEDRQLVLDRHRKRLAGEEHPSTYAFRLMNRHGDELWMQLNTVLINWEGRPATLNFLRDITEQRKLELRLVQAQKMETIGTMAGGIAHDFNNILSPMMLNTEMAMMEIHSDSPAQEYLRQIFSASLRAKDLVKQILTFSRLSKQEFQPLKTGVIIQEALKLLRSTVPATIELNYDTQTESDTIHADPVQIHQMIMNLCTNAAHAMRQNGGELSITLSDVELTNDMIDSHGGLNSDKNYLRIIVRDNGEGIPEEIKERIFDPFFTTKEKSEGTGMGLAVVHGIIETCGGSISLTSELGKGTVFDIILPKVESEIQREISNTQEKPPIGSERILFVDDEKAMVDAVSSMLEKLGYYVVRTSSSIEALEIFRNNPDSFDLVITDMTMPNMTGDKLAQRLIEIRPDIPIIICTGFSEMIDKERAIAIGIKDLLMKPIIRSELATMVRKVLDEARGMDI